jgi:hypothetical protein
VERRKCERRFDAKKLQLISSKWYRGGRIKSAGKRAPALKLPPDIEFHEDIRLLIHRPHGLLNEQSVNKIVSIIEDLEAKLQTPFDRFFDTLGHDEVELNFRYVIHMSLHRRLSYAGHPSVKSAILANDSTIVHYARLHAVLTQGSPINVRVFQDRDEAAQWLGVPIELLAPKS